MQKIVLIDLNAQIANMFLGIKDLLPILSWCFQKGRCRYCQKSISWQYPLLEILLAISALGIYFFFGFNVEAFLLLCLLPFAVSQAVLYFQKAIISRQLLIINTIIFAIYLGVSLNI